MSGRVRRSDDHYKRWDHDSHGGLPGEVAPDVRAAGLTAARPTAGTVMIRRIYTGFLWVLHRSSQILGKRPGGR